MTITQQNTQAKRNLFVELSEGFDALQSERLRQVILCTHSVELPQINSARTLYCFENTDELVRSINSME